MFIRPRLCALGTLGIKVGGSALRSTKGERCYSMVVTANCYRCADRSPLRGNAEERRERGHFYLEKSGEICPKRRYLSQGLKHEKIFICR